MKILSCHIENFGKLSDVDFSFNDNLNVILEDNGFGKSTLTSFIRSMFYGFRGERVRDEIQNERKRFAPWQGGAYGGSLVFSVSGKKYKVSRFFGLKQQEDTFELRDADTNLISSDYSENLGEELFKINSESFMRTVFIGQNEVSDFRATDDVNAKLGNISDGIDLNRFAAAETWFKDSMNAMSETRKTGEIARIKAQISEVKADILSGNGLEEAISSLEERIKARKNLISDLLSSISVNDIKKNELALYEKNETLLRAYKELCTEVSAKEELLSERKAFFKGDIPSDAYVSEWESKADEMKQLRSRISSCSFSEPENELYKNLLLSFSEGIPDKDEIEEMIRDAENLLAKKREAERFILSEEERSKLSKYRISFGSSENPSDKINELSEKWTERNACLNELSYIERNDESESKGTKTGGKGGIILLVLSLCFSLCGAFLFTTFKTVAFGLFFISIFGLIGSIVLIRAEKKTKEAYLKSFLEKEEIKKALLDKKVAYEDEVRKYFARHEILFDETTVVKAFQGLLFDAADYKTLSEKERKLESLGNLGGLSETEFKIRKYLLNFGIVSESDDFVKNLTELKGRARHFETLSLKVSDCSDAKRKYDEIRSWLISDLSAYKIECGTNVFDTVDNVLDVCAEYKSLFSLYEDALNRLSSFENANDIEALLRNTAKKPVESFEEIMQKGDALSEKLEDERFLLQTDERNLQGLFERFEEWQEKQEALKALSEEKEEKLKKLGYITKAWENLAKAKENLTARYMEPLLTGFKKHYSILSGEESDAFNIDANTVITKEEKGKQRNTEFLSTGYKDLIGFCMRIALADAMYKEEKPVLILDDPFVNLDEKKTLGAKRLLNEIASSYQIIFLSCRGI